MDYGIDFDERAFISAILELAIKDAILVKNPKNVIASDKKFQRRKANLKKIIPDFIMRCKLSPYLPYRRKGAPEIRKLYFSDLYKDLKRIMTFFNRNIPENNFEEKAYDAREFLKTSNKQFCTYCDILDFDPEFVEERLQKQFKLFDEGKPHNLASFEYAIDNLKVSNL